MLLQLSYFIISYQNFYGILKGSKSSRMPSWSENYRIVNNNWYRVYAHHFIVCNSLYKPFLSLIFQGITNHLPKIVFAILVENASWVGNIGSRIILDVDVVGLIGEEDWFISAMTCASFVLWFSPYICIRSSLYWLIPSEWLSQFVLFFFNHLLKSYMFASDCDGWNLMIWLLLFAASMHKCIV